VTERYIAPRAYLKLSSTFGATLPHGKTWVEVDTTGLPAGARDSSGMFGAVTGNPKDLLKSLTAIAVSERKLGTGTVRGVPVTGYQLNIDPAKAESRVSRAQRASVGQLFKGLAKTVPVEVWVDGQNLLRRVQLSVGLPGGATGAMHLPGKPRIVVTMDLYDFGVPVNVTAPPASQVVRSPAVGSGGMFGSTAAGSDSASAPAVPIPPPTAVAG
jgi:hypothetical protein